MRQQLYPADKTEKIFFSSFCLEVKDRGGKPVTTATLRDNTELNQEEAVKKMRQSTGQFPFKWNRGSLNFKSLAAMSS